jgi:hypothetical protein
LVFSFILFWEAVNKEVTGQARTHGWKPRIGAWMYAAACLLMAEVAWYSAILSQ